MTFVFSALTVLDGHQKEHPVCKNLSDEVLAWLCVRSEVQIICIQSSWCHCHRIISCCIIIQNGLTFLVLAYPDCSGKEAVKWVSCIDQTAWRSQLLDKGRTGSSESLGGQQEEHLATWNFFTPLKGTTRQMKFDWKTVIKLVFAGLYSCCRYQCTGSQPAGDPKSSTRR